MASNNRIDNIGGVWYFPLYDNNGNVTDYVSEDGEVVASYEYDAFGRTIAQSGAMADEFPFRFSTKYYDAEAKLYYYGERFYSPELGRWLNRDPIEEDGGDNLYAFCGNNGICRHDYLGHVSRGSVDALKKRKGVCYIFTIKVDTVGYDYSSGEAFIKSMSKNAEGVGHSWVRLEDVRHNIVSEGGHSGENGDPGKNGKISSATLDGHELRLWSDPKYSSIRFALPEKMKQELKMWKGSGNYVYW